PQTWDGAFEYIFNIAIDYSNTQQDELYVATALGGILRSTDGGKTFRTVLGSLGNQTSLFTDITVTPKGIVYATMSQIGGGGAVSKVKGIWRSVDGIKWTNITPAGFPEQSYRIAIGVNPKDEQQVFFFGYTPNAGKHSRNFRGDIEWNSLWQFRYLSGDGTGTGGSWENRSMFLPTLGGHFGDIITQSGYDLVVEVHPDDTNTIFVGGTNLYNRLLHGENGCGRKDQIPGNT
ncbi:MAG: WD40/YVTN/BNR-like repeat-containing protein, partial [Bacteroidota bacterium]